MSIEIGDIKIIAGLNLDTIEISSLKSYCSEPCNEDFEDLVNKELETVKFLMEFDSVTSSITSLSKSM